MIRKTSSRLMLCLLSLLTCSSTNAKGAQDLQAGMTIAEVKKALGKPNERSFMDNNEVLQYFHVVGFGQCEYVTAWFTDGVLRSVSTRRGSSVAGCGLGSKPIDWSQMPKAKQQKVETSPDK